MARRLEQALESYLEQAELLEPVQLGAPPAAAILEPDGDTLFGRLHRQLSAHRSRQWLLLFVQCAVFAAGVTAATRTLHSPALTGGVLLAILLPLLWAANRLGRIRSEMATMEILIDAIRNGDEAQTRRLVEMIYWKQKTGSRPSRLEDRFAPFIFPQPEARPPEYDDFVIRIHPRLDRAPALLAASPSGETEASLELDDKILRHADDLAFERVRFRQQGLLAKTRGRWPGAGSLRTTGVALGQRLFEALFPDPIRELYDRNLGRAESSAHRGVRIRLELNPDHRQLARLSSLPWELLCRPPKDRFLGLRRLGPIVRSLDAQRPIEALPLSPPLRVLVVISSPSDLAPLSLERERHEIEAAWRDHPAVKVTCLERATLETLREVLLREDFHVLHFMGHGDLDPATGAGVLFFEARDRRRLAISATALADELEDFARTLRLAVINACHSAHSCADQAGRSADVSTGVATGLVAGGLTSVVAMQFAVTDLAALAFSRTLYRRLAAGDPIDTAVTEGRRTLVRMDPESLEWATPVLFMRAGDGRLMSPE